VEQVAVSLKLLWVSRMLVANLAVHGEYFIIDFYSERGSISAVRLSRIFHHGNPASTGWNNWF